MLVLIDSIHVPVQTLIKAYVHSKIAYAQNSMKVCENIYFGSFYDFTTYLFSKHDIWVKFLLKFM